MVPGLKSEDSRYLSYLYAIFSRTRGPKSHNNKVSLKFEAASISLLLRHHFRGRRFSAAAADPLRQPSRSLAAAAATASNTDAALAAPPALTAATALR